MKKHAAFKWKDAISGFPVSAGSAEALVRWGAKIKHILIAYFLGNICAKNCRNRTVYVKIIASCKGEAFFETRCSYVIAPSSTQWYIAGRQFHRIAFTSFSRRHSLASSEQRHKSFSSATKLRRETWKDVDGFGQRRRDGQAGRYWRYHAGRMHVFRSIYLNNRCRGANTTLLQIGQSLAE